MRRRSRLVAAAIVLIVLGPLLPSEQRFPVGNRTLSASATQIALGREHRQIGQLKVIEAWRLDSPNTAFGGWSALAVTGPRRLLLISDGGWTARFTIGHAGKVARLAIEPLPGTRDISKGQRDTEALAQTPGGDFVVGFENTSKLRRYDRALSRELAAAKHDEMARWPGNAGAEAMTRLGDGRWLVIAEGPKARTGRSQALVFDRVPSDPAARATRFVYDGEGKGAVTDAVTLPDGRVLILHRRFRPPFGFASTIGLADPRAIAADGRWTSTTIGTIDAAPLSDNFEGIALDPDAACGCVWMISDDNFSNWQSNILLKLRLPTALRGESQGRESRAQKKRR